MLDLGTLLVMSAAPNTIADISDLRVLPPDGFINMIAHESFRLEKLSSTDDRIRRVAAIRSFPR